MSHASALGVAWLIQVVFTVCLFEIYPWWAALAIGYASWHPAITFNRTTALFCREHAACRGIEERT